MNTTERKYYTKADNFYTEVNSIKVTMYRKSNFLGNIIADEITLIGFGRREYAQYASVPFVKFKKKRGRNVLEYNPGGYEPFVLIVDGWNNPNPSDGYDQVEKRNGLTIRKSSYACFDERYISDFNELIENENLNVIFDARN